MSKSATSVRDVFELPEPGAPASGNWKTLQEKVTKEVKGIKTAALPDMAEKVAELFDIPIPNIFLTSWKKAAGIQSLLEESRSDPETVMNAELGDHTINSQHRPHIEIRIQNKAVKKIEFTLKLIFNLKGFVLKIQNGGIRGMQTGLCEVRGQMEYQGLVIAEKKLAPIALPGLVSFEGTKSEPQSESLEEKPATADDKPVGLTAARNESSNKNLEESAGARADGITENVSMETSRAIEELAGQLVEPNKAEVSDSPSAMVMLQELTAPEILHAAPAASQNANAVDESASHNVAVPEPEDNVVGQSMTPREDLIAPPQTTEATVEAEDRMTWEVGEDEESAASEQVESTELGSESASEESQTDESAEDVISRMSRELAEKQQSTRAVDETTDRAKAAS